MYVSGVRAGAQDELEAPGVMCCSVGTLAFAFLPLAFPALTPSFRGRRG